LHEQPCAFTIADSRVGIENVIDGLRSAVMRRALRARVRDAKHPKQPVGAGYSFGLFSVWVPETALLR
jgi:hypothetical protein